MAAELTEAQLAQLVRFVARASLEIERGLRPARQLQPLLHPGIVSLWDRRRRSPELATGPVTARDIGPAHLSRNSPGHLVASVTVRTAPDRWGAISMELRQVRGRWLVTSLTRLRARRTPPTRAVQRGQHHVR